MAEQQETPTRGVKLELGGRVLYLRYSLAARKNLIQALGGEDKLRKMTGDQVSTVILEGVRKSAPDVSLEWLEEEIDMLNLPYVTEKLGEAMGQQKKAQVQLGGGEAGEEEQAKGEATTAP